MKLQTKKIIAREFIMLVITIVLVAGVFLGTYIYNYFQHSNVVEVQAAILKKTFIADSLAKPYKTKMQNQQWFYDKNNEIVDLKNTDFNSPNKLWQRLDYLSASDSIKIKIDSFWTPEIKQLLVTIDFDKPEKLTAFINKNRITSDDSTDLQKSIVANETLGKLNKLKADYKAKVFSFQSQTRIAIWTLVILFILLFVMRFLFYAVRWSVKILKQDT
jgi:hypothetical protein